MSRLAAAGGYWKHMRMPFQLLLAPLFLWGCFLSRGEPGLPTVLGFLSLHLFLFPGATAFNSAYDRDVGPVSGLTAPPPVPPRLLEFAIALQIGGFALALFVGIVFASTYVAIACASVAYSHPALRWKAGPVTSSLVVFLGQGVLGFAAGWSAAGVPPALAGHAALAGALGSGLTALGLYPSTQVFQVEEDAARGDFTLAVVLGPALALRAGAACLAVAGAAAGALMIVRFGLLEAGLVAAGFAWLAARHELFARKLRVAPATNAQFFCWATATRHQASVCFLLVTAFLLLSDGWR